MNTYSESFCKKATQVVSAIVRVLETHAEENAGTVTNALREGQMALDKGSFNNHIPVERAVWEIMSVPIRYAFEFDRERHYALIMLTRELSTIHFDNLEQKHALELFRCCS